MSETCPSENPQPLYPDTPPGTTTSSTLRQEWRQRILDALGGEGVDPELTENLLDASIGEALDLFAKHKPLLAWFPFLVPAQETTVITFFKTGGPTNDPNGNPIQYVKSVVDVKFQDVDRRGVPGVGLNGGSYFGANLRWGAQGPRLFFELSVAERTYERLTGTRPGWRWDANTRQLFLTSPSRVTRAMVLTSRPRLLEEITADRAGDFHRAAVAQAKYRLARILGSRGPIPGPAGPITTDAAELRQESKDEWEQVRARLARALTAYPPMQYVG